MSDEERSQILSKIEQELGLEGRYVVEVLYDAEDVIAVEQIEQELESNEMTFDAKDIRQVLYQLSDRGYARSRRHRDDETGWITFLWDLFPQKILSS